MRLDIETQVVEAVALLSGAIGIKDTDGAMGNKASLDDRYA